MVWWPQMVLHGWLLHKDHADSSHSGLRPKTHPCIRRTWMSANFDLFYGMHISYISHLQRLFKKVIYQWLLLIICKERISILNARQIIDIGNGVVNKCFAVLEIICFRGADGMGVVRQKINIKANNKKDNCSLTYGSKC